MILNKVKKEIKEMNSERVFEELINQTYVNSKIAAVKFSNLQTGIRYLFISLAFWFLSLLLIFILSS